MATSTVLTPSRGPLGFHVASILEALAAFLSPGTALGSFLDGSENELEKRSRSGKGSRGEGGTPRPIKTSGLVLAGCRNEDKSLSNPLLNESLEPVPVNASMSKT